MVTTCPAFSRRRAASFWLIRLSSTRRICKVGSMTSSHVVGRRSCASGNVGSEGGEGRIPDRPSESAGDGGSGVNPPSVQPYYITGFAQRGNTARVVVSAFRTFRLRWTKRRRISHSGDFALVNLRFVRAAETFRLILGKTISRGRKARRDGRRRQPGPTLPGCGGRRHPSARRTFPVRRVRPVRAPAGAPPGRR